MTDIEPRVVTLNLYGTKTFPGFEGHSLVATEAELKADRRILGWEGLKSPLPEPRVYHPTYFHPIVIDGIRAQTGKVEHTYEIYIVVKGLGGRGSSRPAPSRGLILNSY